MPQQGLDSIERNAVHRKVRSEGMAQCMAANISHPCAIAHSCECIGQPFTIKRLPEPVVEDKTRVTFSSTQDFEHVKIHWDVPNPITFWRPEGLRMIGISVA